MAVASPAVRTQDAFESASRAAIWPTRLLDTLAEIDGPAIFTTSFGLEDQAITHALAEGGAKVRFVTLDTGRLFPETVEVWGETEARYGIAIEAIQPDSAALADLLGRDGALGMRRGVAERQRCCAIRKIEPLKRALAGNGVWITGLRADQSGARAGVGLVERDEAFGIVKLNPLFDVTREEVLAYAETRFVPLNVLHRRGFTSIGCAPCTRAIEAGEDERAGRWWWENDGKKECGLHRPR